MSIGPSIPESAKPTVLDAARAASYRSMKVFFEKPLHYLFWMSLTALVVGLLFGASFPPQLYAIIFALGVARFTAFIYRNSIDHVTGHGTRT